MAFGVRIKATGGDWKLVPNLIRKLAPFAFGRSADKAVKKASHFLAGKIREGILSGAPGGEPFAPNAPATIRRKGHARPVIDTFTLVESIGVHRIGKARYRIGPPLETPHPKGSKMFPRIIDIAVLMEEGSETFPPRPFVEPVVEENEDEIRDVMLKEFDAAVDARFA